MKKIIIKSMIVLIFLTLISNLTTPAKQAEANPIVVLGGVEVGALAFWGGAALVASVGTTVGLDPDAMDSIRDFGKSAWEGASDLMRDSIAATLSTFEWGNQAGRQTVSWTVDQYAYLSAKWTEFFGDGVIVDKDNKIIDVVVPTTLMLGSTYKADRNVYGNFANLGEWDVYNNGRLVQQYALEYINVDGQGYGTYTFCEVYRCTYTTRYNTYERFDNPLAFYAYLIETLGLYETVNTVPGTLIYNDQLNGKKLQSVVPVMPQTMVIPGPRGILNPDGTVLNYTWPTIGRVGGELTGEVAMGYTNIVGDVRSLSSTDSISYNSTNDNEKEYEDAKRDGLPAPDHTVAGEVNRLEKNGKPLSSKDQLKDGKLYQRRYYGSDGLAEMDIDYSDHKNPKKHPKVPHRHDFDWNNPDPRGRWYTLLPNEENDMYTYEEFIDDLNFGHEFEFSYLGKDYSIIKSQEGWYFTAAEDYNNAVCYQNLVDLLAQVLIGSENLQTVFQSGKVKDLYIF